MLKGKTFGPFLLFLVGTWMVMVHLKEIVFDPMSSLFWAVRRCAQRQKFFAYVLSAFCGNLGSDSELDGKHFCSPFSFLAY